MKDFVVHFINRFNLLSMSTSVVPTSAYSVGSDDLKIELLASFVGVSIE